MNRFHEHYELIRVVGCGGLSEVWLTRDLYTQMEVVVKRFTGFKNATAEELSCLSAEIRNVYQLQHSSLLKAHHFDVCDGVPYVVMPYCKQGNCRSLPIPWPENRLWRLLYDVAAGLDYLHGHGVVHCDIKPDNLLVGDDGGFLITDFGFSAHADLLHDSGFVSPSNLVSKGGTMAYMAPERYSASREVVPASDVWALGATIYEMMTGRQAFAGTSFSGGLLQKNGEDMPAFPTEYSSQLVGCVSSMLSLDPGDRPAAADLVSLAKRHLPDSAVSSRRKRRITRLLVLAGVLVVVVASVAYWTWKKSTVPVGDKEWEGAYVDGLPDGFGTMRYHKRCLIDVGDEAMRYAEDGDYVVGEWSNGRLVQGVWNKADGSSSELVVIGE